MTVYVTARAAGAVVVFAATLLAGGSSRVRAQGSDSGAVFRGRVVRAGDATPIAGADVWVASADRHATTDSTGAFRFDGLPAGMEFVQVRHLGFDAKRDTVRLAAGHESVRTFALDAQVAQLDTVRTRSPQVKYVSPNLRGFEERRLSGMGGHFITDSALRANDYKTLADLLSSRMPGMTVATGGQEGRSVAVSTRKMCRGGAFKSCQTSDCYVSVYLDGALIYYPKMSDQKLPNGRPVVPPPDIRRFSVSDLSGIEFYAGGAAAPTSMENMNDEGCGTLWLWTREK